MNFNKIYNFILSESSNSNDSKTLLKELLQLDNFLYGKMGQVAVQYGNGVHPKHRVTKYHDFFIENVEKNESVIDLGSGLGDVTYDVSRKTSAQVVGMEINKNNILEARKRYGNKRKNLSFIQGDICKDISIIGHTRMDYSTHFDVVIMSNVLEHLNERVRLLRGIIKRTTPKKILLRVPYFEREWIVPVKKELGVNYFLDSTHKIEYTQDEFHKEMDDAGLKIDKTKVNWGEIWAVCVPRETK